MAVVVTGGGGGGGVGLSGFSNSIKAASIAPAAPMPATVSASCTDVLSSFEERSLPGALSVARLDGGVTRGRVADIAR